MFTTKRNILTAAFGLALAASLGACTLNSTEALGIATICGISQDAQASALKLSSQQSAALATVTVFCSNPPTTATAISSDVVAAALLLEPVVAGLIKSASTPAATASKLTALVESWPEAPADLKAAADARRSWGR